SPWRDRRARSSRPSSRYCRAASAARGERSPLTVAAPWGLLTPLRLVRRAFVGCVAEYSMAGSAAGDPAGLLAAVVGLVIRSRFVHGRNAPWFRVPEPARRA